MLRRSRTFFPTSTSLIPRARTLPWVATPFYLSSYCACSTFNDCPKNLAPHRDFSDSIPSVSHSLGKHTDLPVASDNNNQQLDTTARVADSIQQLKAHFTLPACRAVTAGHTRPFAAQSAAHYFCGRLHEIGMLRNARGLAKNVKSIGKRPLIVIIGQTLSGKSAVLDHVASSHEILRAFGGSELPFIFSIPCRDCRLTSSDPVQAILEAETILASRLIATVLDVPDAVNWKPDKSLEMALSDVLARVPPGDNKLTFLLDKVILPRLRELHGIPLHKTVHSMVLVDDLDHLISDGLKHSELFCEGLFKLVDDCTSDHRAVIVVSGTARAPASIRNEGPTPVEVVLGAVDTPTERGEMQIMRSAIIRNFFKARSDGKIDDALKELAFWFILSEDSPGAQGLIHLILESVVAPHPTATPTSVSSHLRRLESLGRTDDVMTLERRYGCALEFFRWKSCGPWIISSDRNDDPVNRACDAAVRCAFKHGLVFVPQNILFRQQMRLIDLPLIRINTLLLSKIIDQRSDSADVSDCMKTMFEQLRTFCHVLRVDDPESNTRASVNHFLLDNILPDKKSLNRYGPISSTLTALVEDLFARGVSLQQKLQRGGKEWFISTVSRFGLTSAEASNRFQDSIYLSNLFESAQFFGSVKKSPAPAEEQKTVGDNSASDFNNEENNVIIAEKHDNSNDDRIPQIPVFFPLLPDSNAPRDIDKFDRSYPCSGAMPTAEFVEGVVYQPKRPETNAFVDGFARSRTIEMWWDVKHSDGDPFPNLSACYFEQQLQGQKISIFGRKKPYSGSSTLRGALNNPSLQNSGCRIHHIVFIAASGWPLVGLDDKKAKETLDEQQDKNERDNKQNADPLGRLTSLSLFALHFTSQGCENIASHLFPRLVPLLDQLVLGANVSKLSCPDSNKSDSPLTFEAGTCRGDTGATAHMRTEAELFRWRSRCYAEKCRSRFPEKFSGVVFFGTWLEAIGARSAMWNGQSFSTAERVRINRATGTVTVEYLPSRSELSISLTDLKAAIEETVTIGDLFHNWEHMPANGRLAINDDIWNALFTVSDNDEEPSNKTKRANNKFVGMLWETSIKEWKKVQIDHQGNAVKSPVRQALDALVAQLGDSATNQGSRARVNLCQIDNLIETRVNEFMAKFRVDADDSEK